MIATYDSLVCRNYEDVINYAITLYYSIIVILNIKLLKDKENRNEHIKYIFI